MRRIAILTAVMMATVGLPAATASHLSTGAITTVGSNGVQETPNDPSVVGKTTGASDTPYGVGTSTDCYEAKSQVTTDQAQDAATAEAVCGDLVYHEGNPVYERRSPIDQDIPGDSPVKKFDVQIYKSTIAAALWRTCLPWCTPGATSPVGDALWTGFHTAGDALGITKGPNASDQEDPDRYQIITTDTSRPNSMSTVQQETGVWEMNGWYGPPGHAERVVAFVEGQDGTPFTSSDLNEYVQNHDMAPGTQAQLCGFTADASFSSSKDLTDCQVKLFYQGPGDDGTADTTFDGYDDKCNSPTYVCAAEGGYWRSRNVGVFAFSGASPFPIDVDDPFSYTDGQDDVFVWHWVMGFNPAECANVEPSRLDFDADNSGGIPYLAHDLDVYTTATDTSTGPSASIAGLEDYGEALRDAAEDAATGELPSVPALPAPVEEALGQAAQTTELVSKDDRVEPNSADDGSSISDSSRSDINVARNDPGPCAAITASETDQTRDPWVNILDGQVTTSSHVPLANLGSADTPSIGFDLYGNQDEGQDASNRPGPNLYSTEGKVGVFADKNDDGDYDQVNSEPYQSKRIQNTGAYPMLWDMNVKDDPTNPQNAGGGCVGPGGSFSSVMDQAGYGPETALAQAIYLKEPTAFVETDPFEPETVEYPAGNNIYVLTNNAGRVLWDTNLDDPPDNTVEERIDHLVEELRTLVSQEYGANADTIEVKEPGDRLGVGSDYDGQCDEGTGGFDAQISFTHSCQVDCTGDTVATMYTFDVDGTEQYPETVGGGQSEVPTLQINGEVYKFGSGQHTWYDLDPLDNDPDRNEQQKSPPPSG